MITDLQFMLFTSNKNNQMTTEIPEKFVPWMAYRNMALSLSFTSFPMVKNMVHLFTQNVISHMHKKQNFHNKVHSGWLLIRFLLLSGGVGGGWCGVTEVTLQQWVGSSNKAGICASIL